jgi:hypothetical protein
MKKGTYLKARKADVAHLDALYEGRELYFGDLHNHAKTGGRSDGKRTLEHWKGALEALGMDFVGIYDHRQVRHMYLPEWEDGTFICGTEPGTRILDCDAIDGKNEIHYNMIVPNPKVLEEILTEFEGYEFEGGPEGFFKYLRFTREEFCELIDAILDKGGFFVHPHPKQYLQSNDPLDYWFRDETGIEVFYYDMRSEYTKKNYQLWCDLLALGKRVFACAGEDGHKCARDTALTAIYAEEKSSPGFIKHLRVGDFVCGSVALRMCVGDTKMGGKCSFDGKRLCVSVDRFHRSVANTEHKYELVILDDKGVVARRRVSCTEPTYFAFDTDASAKFYRTEIIDINLNLRISIGNPIWNE